jgi:hypothetical protein
MIPTARFGSITTLSKEENLITVKLFSLYKGGIKKVAANKTFCFWILTALYEDLAFYDNINWGYKDIDRKKAAELYNSIDNPQTKKILNEAHTLLRDSWVDFKNKEELITALNSVKFPKKQEVYIRNQERKNLTLKRLEEYGYEMIEESPIAIEYLNVKIPITSSGIEYFKQSNESVTEKTNSSMDQRRYGDFIGLEDMLKDFGNEFTEYDQFLKAKILFPILPKQLDLLLKFYDSTNNIQLQMPADEEKFEQFANEYITNLTVSEVIPSASSYEEIGTLSFSVKDADIAKHIEAKLWLSFD